MKNKEKEIDYNKPLSVFTAQEIMFILKNEESAMAKTTLRLWVKLNPESLMFTFRGIFMINILKDLLSEKQYKETKSFKFITNIDEIKLGYLYRVMFIGYTNPNEKYDIIAKCINKIKTHEPSVIFKPVYIVNRG